MAVICTVGLLVLAGLLALQLGHVLGRGRGLLLGLLAAGVLAGAWWLLAESDPPHATAADWSRVASVPSDACFKCHPDHHESWYRSYHRTMTREATPETVKGDFENAVHRYQGLTTRLTREGGAFFMETVDPGWAFLRARAGGATAQLPPPRSRRF